MISVKFTAFCDLRIRLATLRNSVRKFWFCKLCVNLHRLASPFGQGLKELSEALLSVLAELKPK